RARREPYIGPWLPEPLVSEDPADRVTLDESVSYALLTVLEQLSPAERTAFVLYDVFGVPLGEAAEVGGRGPAPPRAPASPAPPATTPVPWGPPAGRAPRAPPRPSSRCSPPTSSGRRTV